MEILYESGIADSLNRVDAPFVTEGETGDSTKQTEVANVTKQTTETLMAGERIMEALDLADAERAAFKEFEESMSRLSDDAMRLQPPSRNPVLVAYDLEPDEYVLRVVEKVPNAALQDALLVLPFGKVVSLMNYLNEWAQKVIIVIGAKVCCSFLYLQELNILLVSHIIFFLLKTHHHQIVTNRIMRTALIPLRIHLRLALRRQKDTIGYNLAALQYLRQHTDLDQTEFFETIDEEKVHLMIAEKRKRKWVNVKV